MRLLHTADWHLGARSAALGERAADSRAQRLKTAEKLVDLAAEQAIDIVLVAGDVFDRPDVDAHVVGKAIDLLNEFAPRPVVILPGNHDPAGPGSVWSRRDWRRLDPCVQLATEPEVMEILPQVRLFPCPLDQKVSRLDPTAWIPRREDGDEDLRIGLAHGSLDTLSVTTNFPISRDRAELSGLDYLALGDWHSLSVHTRSAYPGALEATSFGEKLAGYVLLVDLDPRRQRPPEVEPVRVGRFQWKQLEAEIAAQSDLERLEQELRTLGPWGDLVLRMKCRVVAANPELLERIAELRGELERAFSVEWSTEVVDVEGGDLPGLLQQVDESLQALIAGDGSEALAEFRALSADVASEARLQLRFALARSTRGSDSGVYGGTP